MNKIQRKRLILVLILITIMAVFSIAAKGCNWWEDDGGLLGETSGTATQAVWNTAVSDHLTQVGDDFTSEQRCFLTQQAGGTCP